ncbi:MAG: hypothetical protein CML68_23885 [Rhodobacteraceae bacterium]|nr:hypothetical protein [Paracoccaceae bacterium]
MRKRDLLETAPHSARKNEILQEVGLDLTAYLEPIGVLGADDVPETIDTFLTILSVCEEVGLRYKHRFDRARPIQMQPELRPFVPTPVHESYPSNHSFQSFSIALAFARAVPEHPNNPGLFQRARRVAENREWAGIHYRSDTLAGLQLAHLFLPTLEWLLADQLQDMAQEWR